ncbi:MAG: redox-regulated ATPase YchF [Actinobacteria bacterium]|nr:redox-regulated ATPase YchF [Actinomycetota bacterium]
MQVGIIGLPNVGKSTIYNTLTKANAAVANYPFCTIEPNVGLINVPDDNLEKLSKIYNSAKTTNASIRIVDVAGLVKGASKGEGLGNKFLSHIREVDVIAHVVRCFKDDNVSHISSEIKPDDDIETINTELMLADLETLGRKKEKLAALAKSQDIQAKNDLELTGYLIDKFSKGDLSDINNIRGKNPEFFSDLNLLSLKPVLYIANMGDDGRSADLYDKVIAAAGQKNEVIKIFGKLEAELLEIGESEREIYRKELGLEENGLHIFIKKCYSMLNLLTFYTLNENETRAWPLKTGSKIIEAAGKIHTDMQKGFIKADVIGCKELLSIGSMHKAKEEGKVRSEGREYTVRNEDVILIKFSL